jgi:hypothetical protein
MKLMTGAGLLVLLAACGPKEVILQGERFPIRADLDASIPVEGPPPPRPPHRKTRALRSRSARKAAATGPIAPETRAT